MSMLFRNVIWSGWRPLEMIWMDSGNKGETIKALFDELIYYEMDHIESERLLH